MEGLAALGLAATIMQVVDFTGKVLREGKKILESGSTEHNADRELIASDLRLLSDKVKAFARPEPHSNGPLNQDSQALEDLAKESSRLADQLCSTLLSVRLKGHRTRLKGILRASKTAWNSKRIRETSERLQDIRDEIQLRILVSIKSSIDTAALADAQELTAFDESTRNIIHAIIENKDDLQAVVREQTRSIEQTLTTSNAAAEKRHTETLSMLEGLSTKVSCLQSPSKHQFQNPNPEKTLQMLKDCLDFERRDDRYEAIKPAHAKTLEWIYEENHASSSPWTSLKSWFHNESGIYWICGKAGSGKSTLMKYLSQNFRTAELIQNWAGDTRYLKLSFFFWNLGTDLHRSTRGLYQSILCDALNEIGELGQVLFPEQYLNTSHFMTSLSDMQLRQGFHRLLTQQTIPLKLIFKIDGLDEFEDATNNMDDLTELFISAAQQPNVKAILSSRPHQVFAEAFAACTKLHLHELTQPDITLYVQDHVGRHPRMQALSLESPTEVQHLVRDVVNSSSGVFVWVKLVVRSLLEGLRNYDTLADLAARLDELPKDLHALFNHLLGTIPDRYRLEASKMFQLVRCHTQHMAMNSPTFFAQPEIAMLTMYFALGDLEMLSKWDVHPIQEREMLQKRPEMIARLRTRCAGLIEFQWPDPSSGQDNTPDRGLMFRHDLNPGVQFLHKSVADFFEDPEIWATIVKRTEGSEFEPNKCLLHAFFMVVKCFPCDNKSFGDTTSLWFFVHNALSYARYCEMLYDEAQEELLDELDRVMQAHFEAHWEASSMKRKEVHSWYDTFLPTGEERIEAWHDTFISLAVRYELNLYITAKFDRRPPTYKKGRPLVHYACSWRKSFNEPEDEGRSQVQVLDTLLRYDCLGDVNQIFDGESAWQMTLTGLNSLNRDDAIGSLRLMKRLIIAGADPHATVYADPWQDVPKVRRSALFQIVWCITRITEPSSLRRRAQGLHEEIVKMLQLNGASARVFVREDPNDPSSPFVEESASSREYPFLRMLDEPLKSETKFLNHQ